MYAFFKACRFARSSRPRWLRLGLVILIALFISASILPGRPLAVPFMLGDMTTDLDGPAVAYDSQHGLYLLAWSVDNGSADTLILTWLDRHGTLLSFEVYDPDADHSRPALAYNPDRDEFLLVWQNATGVPGQYPNINAQVVRCNGTKGSEMILGSTSDMRIRTNPSVAYNRNQTEYLVAWESTVWQSGTFDIEGQYLYSWGTKKDTNFMIASGTNSINHEDPDVAASAVQYGFLVAWEREDEPSSNTDIYASTMIDNHPNAPLLIATQPVDELNPAATSTASGVLGEYLVVWEHRFGASDGDIYTRTYDGYGTLGITQPLAVETSDQTRPDVAGHPLTRQYLLTWTETGASPLVTFAVARNYLTLPQTFGDSVFMGGLKTEETAVAAGPSGDFLVLYEEYQPFSLTIDIWGRLWGERQYLPLVAR